MSFSNNSFSAHLVKWIMESNRLTTIVEDQELHELLTAGQPNIKIPSADTVLRDIKASFEKCGERVAKLLQVRSNLFTGYHASHLTRIRSTQVVYTL